jgi:transporter family protein
MKVEVIYAICAMVFYGAGVFIYKLGIPGFSSGLGASIYIGSHLLVLGTLAFIEQPQYFKGGFKFLIIAGIVSGLAQLFFFLSLRSGKIHVVVPIRNLSLIVTVLLGVVILSEKLTLLKGLGLVFGVVAIVLLAI